MSATSHSQQVQLALKNAIFSLGQIHGFDTNIVQSSEDISTLGSIRLYGRKQLSHNAGARIDLVLTYNQKRQLWFITKFETSCVYMGSTGSIEVDIQICSGSAFLSHMGKSLTNELTNSSWTITCGRDFFALCEAYDKASVQLGYAPVFFTRYEK